MKGGGHAMAAGVTLRKEKLAEFRAYMENALAHDVAQSRHVNELFIDGAVSARGVTPDCRDAEPRRSLRQRQSRAGARAAVASTGLADEVGQAHLRLRFKSGDGAIVNGIAFRSIGQKLGNALLAQRGQACMSRDRSRSIAIRARSACSCACSMSPCRIRGRR